MLNKSIAVTVGACALSLAQTASAAVITFTDRAAWEAAVTGIQTETFDSVAAATLANNATTTVGSLDVETVVPPGAGGTTRVEDGANNPLGTNVNGTNYLRFGLDGTPKREVNITFDTPVVAWGADYQFGPLTDPAEVTVDGVATNFGGRDESGFIGFISDTAFSDISFRDPFVSVAFFGLDNLSTATARAVTEPAAAWLLGLGLLGLGGLRRKNAEVQS